MVNGAGFGEPGYDGGWRMDRMVLGMAMAAAFALAGCDRMGGQGQQGQPAPYNNGGNGWPGAQPNGQPWQMAQTPGQQGFPPGPQGPYPPGGPPQGPYPPQGQDGGYPQPNAYAPQGPQGYPQQPPQGFPPQGLQGPQGPQGPGGGTLQVSGPPPGMAAMPTPAGYVFTTQLSGSPQASKLAQAVLQGTQSYFDGPSRILNTQTDPSERMSRVDFSNTLHGQPVMGMIGVQGDGQNAGVAYLLFDSADRVQQTMPMMMAATQRRPNG